MDLPEVVSPEEFRTALGLGAEARRGGRGPLRALELVIRDFFLSRPDRLVGIERW